MGKAGAREAFENGSLTRHWNLLNVG
jgi:hypothetical protein